ncbi:MAG: polyprenyl synthetase family protein [Candidatus Moraniibacteriota bacterium]
MKKNLAREAIIKLKAYKNVVDKELKLFFARQLEECRDIDGTACAAISALEDFSLRGGKRIRAALIYYGFLCFSKEKPGKDLLRASMAMELVQSFLLIHDDIIDRDELRRGEDTVHKIFEKIGEKKFSFGKNIREKEHFGRSAAILVGDVCVALANMALAEVKSENKTKANYELNRVIRNTTFGQIIDLESSYREIIPESTIQETLKIYRLKTAAYTIEVPLRIGAILAGATDREIDKIRHYAEPLGVAFNIQDDILGLFGKKEKFGKPIGSDLKEGKKTLILLKALELATKEDSAFIMKNLGARNMSEKTVDRIKEIMLKTGAYDYCVNYAKDLIMESKKIISRQIYHEKGKSFILGISDYLLEREC